MKPSNWVIALCAAVTHNYAAIITYILIITVLAPSLTTASEARSVGDHSRAAFNEHDHFVTVASWYGPGYEGRRTTSGEIFDSSKLTAASLVLPLGSHVTVTSLNNGLSVTLRINDCGSHLGRNIDLSRAAAQRIGSIKDGIVPVRIKVVDVPKHAQLCTSQHIKTQRAISITAGEENNGLLHLNPQRRARASAGA
jgi:rare lipoprotein A (peptidoglycan hydrolase)